MSILVVKTRDGARHEIAVTGRVTVMEAIRDAGIDELTALCGGSCSCATCHIFLDDEFALSVDAMGADESDLLDGSEHRSKNSRLGCQVWITEGNEIVNVAIAPED